MAVLKVCLGKNGRPITPEERAEMERERLEYDRKVMEARSSPQKAKKGTFRGNFLKGMYGQ